MQYTLTSLQTSLLLLREALNSPPSVKKRLRPLPSPLQGENERGGNSAGGLGLGLVFPHDVKSQLSYLLREAYPPSVKKKGFVLCHLPYKGRTRGVGRGWRLGLYFTQTRSAIFLAQSLVYFVEMNNQILKPNIGRCKLRQNLISFLLFLLFLLFRLL